MNVHYLVNRARNGGITDEKITDSRAPSAHCLLYAGCIFSDDDKTSDSGSSALIGTWEYWIYYSEYTQRETLTFNKDGTFNFGSDYTNPTETVKIYGTYTVSGSIVTLTYKEMGDEYVDKYTFSISGKKLMLKNVYQDLTLVYTKV